VLSAVDVRVQFAGRGRRRAAAIAVDGVNLDIAPGEIVAQVGESGVRQDHAGAGRIA
jgi:ABC-type dipeptide/oligopeptide/nickel transport system ATPase component